MDMVTIDRTYKTLFLIACCLLCLCSCNKEDAQDDANTDLFNVSIAHYSSPGNKSYIVPGENHEFACWNDGDRIGSVVAMDATVSICARVNAVREQAASRFRADLRKKPVSESFSAAQIMGAADVLR